MVVSQIFWFIDSVIPNQTITASDASLATSEDQLNWTVSNFRDLQIVLVPQGLGVWSQLGLDQRVLYRLQRILGCRWIADGLEMNNRTIRIVLEIVSFSSLFTGCFHPSPYFLCQMICIQVCAEVIIIIIIFGIPLFTIMVAF